MDDRTLLRSYALHRDQAAFAELVRRHADLVYSAARRQVGDHHRAQEVTQSVFLALARKAGALADHPALAAWLFHSTRLSSTKLRETERRRVVREDRAARVSDETAVADVRNLRDTAAGPAERAGEWDRIAPGLDEALAGLREKDRAAVVLRFLQQRSYADIAAALGMGEGAARMRTERALEKLRAALVRRGVRSTAEALGMALGAHGVMAAPTGTGTSVLAAVVAAGGAAKLGSGFTLLFMGKIKIAGVALVAAGLASLATYLSLRPRPLVALPASVQIGARVPAETSPRPAADARDDHAAGLEQENADLRASLAEAAAELEKRGEELARANKKLATLRRPLDPGNTHLLSSTLKVATKPGEVIVTDSVASST